MEKKRGGVYFPVSMIQIINVFNKWLRPLSLEVSVPTCCMSLTDGTFL